MNVFTEERLQELEQLGPSEANLFKAELRELIQAYRERPRVVKNATDGAWLIFKSPSGKSGAISVECLALERGPLTSAALHEWSDSLRVTENVKTPLRDSDAAFNLGVLPTEQPENGKGD